MNQDELFSTIGRLYIDIYNAQKYIDILQKQLQEKDKEIQELRKLNTKDE